MEDALPELARAEASGDDVGLAGPYEQDSDDESVNDGEPPAKRARELQVCASKHGEAHGEDRVRRANSVDRVRLAEVLQNKSR